MVNDRRPQARARGRQTFAVAARGETPALHRGGRGAPRAGRDAGTPAARFPARCDAGGQDREYLIAEQCSRRGRIARRMRPGFHDGLPSHRR